MAPTYKKLADAFAGEESVAIVAVDATENRATAEAYGVKGYPTWVFADGTSVSGEVPLVRLAELSGYRGKFDPALEPELRSAGVRCGAQ